VIVTVIPVRMVQVVLDKVIHVIPMRHPLVATRRAVHVSLLMMPAVVLGGAARWMLGADLERVFVDVIAVHVMEVPVVQVIDVVSVLDGDMSASWSVGMAVSFMHLAGLLTHRTPLLSEFRLVPSSVPDPDRHYATTGIIRSPNLENDGNRSAPRIQAD